MLVAYMLKISRTKKLCYKYFVKTFKIDRNIEIYLFFLLFNQQSYALNSVTTNALMNFFLLFIMTPSIGISWISKSLKVLHFSAKNLFVSFRVTGAIFCKKISGVYYLVLLYLQEIE